MREQGEAQREVTLHLLVTLELGGGTAQVTPVFDGLEDHLGVGKKNKVIRCGASS